MTILSYEIVIEDFSTSINPNCVHHAVFMRIIFLKWVGLKLWIEIADRFDIVVLLTVTIGLFTYCN